MSNDEDVTSKGTSPTLKSVLESIGFESLEAALESKLKKIKAMREEANPDNQARQEAED